LLVILLIAPALAFAQKKIKLLPGSGKLEGFKKNGVSYTSVTKNVAFKHKATLFYCDSAVLIKKANYLEAYGHVRILDGDSVKITSDKLFYSGETRLARLRENVVLTKLDQMKIYTDFLDYDRNTGIAAYFNNGKIVDTTNVIVSDKGYYNTRTNMVSFKTNVEGKNEDYTMTSDTLVYNTKTGIVYFVSPTTLVDNEGSNFQYEGGQYKSKEKRSNFSKGKVVTEDYILKGKSLHLDDIRKVYTVQGNVEMISKSNDVIITGQHSVYKKDKATTRVFEWPMMKIINDQDTLFLVADTLVSIDNKVEEEKRLLAYHHVRYFNKDIQGVADSMAYFVKDSLIFMYSAPVLWTEQNQITADTIMITLHNKEISKLDMSSNSFVITEDSLGTFNQIKGRVMEATFKHQQIEKVNVKGNGESIFYMYDKEKGSLIGMNKIICSDIDLFFKDGQLEDAKFLVNPEGDFIPPHELKPDDERLKGFVWRLNERPNRSTYNAYEFPATQLPSKTYPKVLPEKSNMKKGKFKKKPPLRKG